MSGMKRSLEDSSHDADLPSPSASFITSVKPASPTALPSASAASSFRNVSACNRCRLRKNRCDQRLPSCASCDKAAVKCVGYDPITKREIPRRYVWQFGSLVGGWKGGGELRTASAQLRTDQLAAMSTTSKPASPTSRHCCKTMQSKCSPPTTSTRALQPMAPLRVQRWLQRPSSAMGPPKGARP
jgi:hypothetical protein